jgi:membrane protein
MSLLAPFRLIYRTIHRFHTEQFVQSAAALSFTTLLALVPMVALAFALISQFSFASGLSIALEKFLLATLLPDKAGALIGKYLSQFAHRSDQVTLIGMAALAFTALMQMLTIERAFNAIWRIGQHRPFVRRITMHTVALLLGPIVFGAALLVLTFIVTTSLGLLDEPVWVKASINKGVSFIFAAVLFAILYWRVPNTEVPPFHALFGGLVAAAGFTALQKLFALYIVKLPTFTIMYGAFSIIPVFLIWIYASWSVILGGALLVAEMSHSPKPMARRNLRRKSLL